MPILYHKLQGFARDSYEFTFSYRTKVLGVAWPSDPHPPDLALGTIGGYYYSKTLNRFPIFGISAPLVLHGYPLTHVASTHHNILWGEGGSFFWTTFIFTLLWKHPPGRSPKPPCCNILYMCDTFAPIPFL